MEAWVPYGLRGNTVTHLSWMLASWEVLILAGHSQKDDSKERVLVRVVLWEGLVQLGGKRERGSGKRRPLNRLPPWGHWDMVPNTRLKIIPPKGQGRRLGVYTPAS